MKTFLARIVYISISFFFINTAQAENQLEPWYTYWGLGLADFSYSESLNASLNRGGLSNTSLTLDLLGFYWPKGENMLLGVVLNAAGDRYADPSDHFQINSYLASTSTMYFFKDRVGKGPFIRFDIGATKTTLDSSLEESLSTSWKMGVLFGGGFGFPITEGTRLLLNLNYSIRKTEGDNLKILGLTVGGLF